MNRKMRKISFFILCLILSLSCVAYVGCAKQPVVNNDAEVLSVLTNDFNIGIGQSCHIETLFNGKQDIVYESTNTNVATVDNNGNVLAKGEGVAFIKISVGDQTEICKITVNRDVYNVLLNLNSSSIKVNSTIYLSANQYKNGQMTSESVEWLVSGDDVENCQLTNETDNAIKFSASTAGNYVITAKTANAASTCSIKVLSDDAVRAQKPILTIENCNLIKWAVVDGATSYDVLIDDNDWINITATEFDISQFTDSLRLDDSICVYVKAKTDDNFNFIDSQISTLTFSHEFKETGDTDATCTKSGSMTYDCDNCSITYVENNYYKPHNFEHWVCKICSNYKTDGVTYLFDDNYVPMPTMDEGFDENSAWRKKYSNYYDLSLINENSRKDKTVLNRLLWNQVDDNKNLIPQEERQVCYYASSLLDTTLTEVYIAGSYDDGVHGRHDVKYVKRMFSGNNVVKKVVMDENITELRGTVFQFSGSVETIIMPGVSYIPGADRMSYSNNNFNSCYSLKQLVFGDGLVIQGRNFYAQKQIGGNLDAYKCQAEIYVLGSGDKPANITTQYDDLLSIFTGNVYYQHQPDSEDDIHCKQWYYDENGEIQIRHHKYENNICIYDNCHAYNDNNIVYKYDQESDSYFVAPSKFYTKSSVVIPEYYYDGIHGNSEKPVTKVLSSAFYNNQYIEQVYLPDTVTEISSGAFGLCKNLKLVDLGGVEILGRDKNGVAQQNAFVGCNALRYVIVKKSLDVQVQTFIKGSHNDDFGFNLLVKESGGTFNIPDVNSLWTADSMVYLYDQSGVICQSWKWNEIKDDIILKSHEVKLDGYCSLCSGKGNARAAVTYTYDSTIDGYVASDIGTFNQAKLYIADYYDDGINGRKAVKKIAGGLFDGAGGTAVAKNRAAILTHVYMPDTIEVIGGASFRLCEKLVFVKMSANIKTIEANAFQSCHNLEAMIIQKSLDCVSGAFNGGGAWEKAKMNIYALEAGGTINITSNEKPLFTGNVYIYSENEASGCWHYVDGVPTLW